MPRVFDPAGFAREACAGRAEGASVITARATTPQIAAGASREISYVLSTSAVARDFHTIATAGWMLDNYLSNPVFLWAHDTAELPIGRMVDIGVVGNELRGTVDYADRDLYPFADTVFQMVKGRFLNAVSVSWNPLKWVYSTDRKRPGGIDFLEQDLLEVSQCPVPCLADALATARAAGIDTGPAVEWAERLLDSGGRVAVDRAELERLRQAAGANQRFYVDCREARRIVAHGVQRKTAALLARSKPRTRAERAVIAAKLVEAARSNPSTRADREGMLRRLRAQTDALMRQ